MKRTLYPGAVTIAAAIISFFLSCPPVQSKLPDMRETIETRPVPAATALNAKGKTVFDASHREIFSPVKKRELDYSGFSEMLKASGEDVGVNSGRITQQTLQGVKTYIIAGPTEELGHREIGALHSFVNQGGNLLILLHISSPVARLTESFGILVSNFVLAEQTGSIGGQPQDFLVTRFTPHPVTEGLERIAVYGTWGLLAEGKAREVASTSDKAWADLNRDRKLDEGEPTASFGVIAVSGYGGGKVVVAADDAPFANMFLKEADNSRLAGNIIDWFNE